MQCSQKAEDLIIWHLIYLHPDIFVFNIYLHLSSENFLDTNISRCKYIKGLSVKSSAFWEQWKNVLNYQKIITVEDGVLLFVEVSDGMSLFFICILFLGPHTS